MTVAKDLRVTSYYTLAHTIAWQSFGAWGDRGGFPYSLNFGRDNKIVLRPLTVTNIHADVKTSNITKTLWVELFIDEVEQEQIAIPSATTGEFDQVVDHSLSVDQRFALRQNRQSESSTKTFAFFALLNHALDTEV